MSARKSRISDPSARAERALRSLPFDEHIPFQKMQWRVERLAWAGMLAVIVAALVGVFGGGGPIDRATASDSAGSSEIEYARFARYSSPTTLEIKLTSSAPGQTIRIRINDQYLSQMRVRAITPPPTSTALADRQHVFVFERSALPGPVTIQFELEPAAIGRHRGSIAVDGAAPLSFAHFIYP